MHDSGGSLILSVEVDVSVVSSWNIGCTQEDQCLQYWQIEDQLRKTGKPEQEYPEEGKTKLIIMVIIEVYPLEGIIDKYKIHREVYQSIFSQKVCQTVWPPDLIRHLHVVAIDDFYTTA